MANKNFSEKNVESVKEGPGVYKLYNSQGSLTYVGIAKNVKEVLRKHFNKRDISNIRRFEVKNTKTITEAERIGKNIIRRFKPHHNL